MPKGKIDITRKEFSDSCRRHYRMYKETEGTGTANVNSRRLLLFYSAECGLKSCILSKIGKNTYLELDAYCKANNKGSCGHDIKNMLRMADIQHLDSLQTIRLYGGREIKSKQFNELWRYGAKVADEKECEEAEETLRKIVEWLIVRI